MNKQAIKYLSWLFGALLVFGLIAVASASSVLSRENFGEPFYFFTHQVTIGFIPGLVGFVLARLVPTNFIKKSAAFVYAGGVFLVGLVFVPGLGFEYGGAKRWLNLGLISIQPAEFMKVTLLIFLAAWLAKLSKKQIQSFKQGALPFAFIVAIPSALLLLQPDVGTLIVTVLSATIVYYFAGAKIRHLLILAIAAVLVVGSVVALSPSRTARITTFFNPQSDVLDSSYQVNQSLVAIGSGGIFGRGLGQSRQKYNYLPEPAGDTIFAVIGEELGFVVTAIIVAVYILMTYLGIRIAHQAPDTFSRLLILGIITLVVIQAFTNMAAATALLPFTGVPLPLISYGGSSLASLMIAFGLLFTAARPIKRGRH